MKILSSLFQFFYNILNNILRYCFYDPALCICLSGLYFHQNPSWLLATLLFGLLHWHLDGATALLSALNSQTEAIMAFLSEDSKFEIVKEVDISLMLTENDVSLYKLRKRFALWFAKQMGVDEDDLHYFTDKQPFRAFVVRRKGGGFVGAAKAYGNPGGVGLIFLSKFPGKMSIHDKFLLFHELEHVNSSGAFQLGDIIFCKQYSFISFLFLTQYMNSIINIFFIILYIIEIVIIAFRGAPAYREVLADNRAFHRISGEDLKSEVPEDLVEKLQDDLLGDQPITEFQRWEINLRIYFANYYLKLKGPKRNAFHLNWVYKETIFQILLVVPFFIYIGFKNNHPNINIMIIFTVIFTISYYKMRQRITIDTKLKLIIKNELANRGF